MNKSEFEALKEVSGRRKLTDEEQSALDRYLLAHSEECFPWANESQLNEILAELPDAPVSTNFTARVLQAVHSELNASSRRQRRIFYGFKLNWIPRLTIVIVLLSGSFISLQHYHREQIARDVAAVSSAATVPPQWLQDFDAINRLSQPPVDNDLLAALQ